MSFSHASVVETKRLNRRLVRVTLRIEDPVALDVQQGGDSAVGVYFPGEGAAGEGRNYSVRRQRGDLIDLDVVLHARGVGTSWAVQTRPGDRVGLDHARSWYRPEPSSEWQLLITDLSGLPATARIIEELTPGLPVTVIAEVAEAADLDYLPTLPQMNVLSSIGTGNGHAPSRLATLVRDLPLPDGRGYCWFAGEAAESRAVRKYLREQGYGIDQLDITGYWRFDSETWDAKFALVESEVLAVYERALSDGKGDKIAFEEFDEACERIGL
ncbi:siderophore-interacting protein [Mycobacterium sp. 21AC1]|uniref:siderophore-interacting protein n=1 Tax=[Mycobacterium] appelbergii TaxID=2939269 RepID=UPI002938EB09|nr:siderophore-interacting protein [Mycobacterium sp. 21AC1]MDV3123375.1 siderophore-interacting protein [Mycobacterium sp. 21AC1]